MHWRKWWGIVPLLFCGLVSQAQERYGLERLIGLYEERQEVKCSFDPELIQAVTADFSYQDDFSQFVYAVESKTPLSIQQVDQSYYIIKASESRFFLQAYDSLEQESIVPTDIMVLVNSTPLTLDYAEEGVYFQYKPVLQDTLILFALGYDKRLIPFHELMNESALEYQMMNIAVELKGLTIQEYLTKGIDLEPSNQSIRIDVEDLPLLPGETDGDIFASIAALPGVTSPDQRAGNLFIRGSYTDQSLILFDDIPIYHRGHYYGTISPYNPKVISNVTVYRSGFHPRMGDRVGGAIVIESEEEIYNKPTVGLGANTLYAMAYGKAALAKNKVGISIGARRSYPSSISSPKLTAISESVFSGTGVVDSSGAVSSDLDILFQDYHTKINYQANEKNRLSLAAIYTSNDIINYSAGPQTNSDILEENLYENQGYNLKWQSDFSDNWSSQTSLTYSRYHFNYTTDPGADGDSLLVADNEVDDFNLRQEFNQHGEILSSDFGLDYKYQLVGTDYINEDQGALGLYTLSDMQKAHSLSPFVNFQLNPNAKWDIQLGLRATYFDPAKTINWDPRMFANYSPNSWLSLKASLGWYHQYLSQAKNLEFGGGGFENELWIMADGDEKEIIKGKQATLGGIIHASGWIFDVEGFYKQTDGVNVYTNRRLSSQDGYISSSQWIRGVDLMLKKQLTSHANAWVSYSYSQSEITMDTAQDRSFTSKFVQPHVLYIGSSYVRNRWKLSASWKWSTGLYERSLDIIYAEEVFKNRPNRRPPPGDSGSDGMRPPNPFVDVNSDYYEPVHSLDISASYTLPRTEERKWAASFGLSLANVTNQKNLIDGVFRRSFVDRYGMGFAPNLMVLVEF
jgi:hypothetical protein